ncbi:fumarylacetoacetate hydrolase family protein [Solemya velum gill symbiont]|uniref:2-keto-4-pentenoate hydratase/2-oxohepta-3-ene-1,7-dioic acid hydratase n=1 Tax=Solemya velum gill symbiont TaxID=2340 RepID=A0A0B0H9L8_SOVGS|nr:fumarylacetoacetate hydrolase family protein [Solemya velum gill symbiont]KHF24574.1 2-keto-4-pentenoate hydratase/2-oxohepta-3-ene-1,7-dioic acid hydratase [Solemya velum gill symbiont]OOY34665.1 hypothetical protein BOV88_08640 [Solemya velum gill symbiont]OOY37460.1 hypothetical protein BOV89_07070 [Solemya velum gill symbiont]OOY41653.1 hypothetical protein BOV91_10340 [Solemya velum gill symbiont]OOY45339.1 hypothetical protein BOV92_05650 [Solemya velum gill symbiont]
MTNSFKFLDQDGSRIDLNAGKIVAIGRNYHAHIEELNNPVPDKPVIFMKPSTALRPLHEPVVIPTDRGAVHYEIELAVLIAEEISCVDEDAVADAIGGYALALDLTLRDVQEEVKNKGLPWEMAKSWDGSCPLGRVLPADTIDPANAELQLVINGEVRQQANTRMMIRGAISLISYISRYFTLEPGDLVLTGTPSGVGSLNAGDQLELSLDQHSESTQITTS